MGNWMAKRMRGLPVCGHQIHPLSAILYLLLPEHPGSSMSGKWNTPKINARTLPWRYPQIGWKVTFMVWNFPGTRRDRRTGELLRMNRWRNDRARPVKPSTAASAACLPISFCAWRWHSTKLSPQAKDWYTADDGEQFWGCWPHCWVSSIIIYLFF